MLFKKAEIKNSSNRVIQAQRDRGTSTLLKTQGFSFRRYPFRCNSANLMVHSAHKIDANHQVLRRTHTLPHLIMPCALNFGPLTPWIYVHVYVIYLLTLERCV